MKANQLSVITGAAGGFGRALAYELASRGGRLVLSDVNMPGLEETAAEALRRGALDVKTLRCDVAQLADVQRLAEACDGPVDLLVNNAGVSSGGLIGELPVEDWRWTLEIDLFGVIYGCHVFAPMMKKQGHGKILNVASAAGLLCLPKMGAYNVAKAGVIALSETLAGELEGTGVGVTVLCPTFFQTQIVSSGRFVDEETRRMANKMMTTARPVEEVVAAALASVERGDLYAVPMADARWFWRLKRAVPESYRWIVGQGLKLVKGRG